jgi:hypothetical protein
VSRARLLSLCLCLWLVGLVVGCGSTSASDTLTPITGITVRAETLTAGRGCGKGPTQVFKYAVVVFGRNPGDTAKLDTLVAGGVYDCFTDAQFVNVPASAGSFDYSLQVFAYNAAAYQAAGDGPIRAAALDPTKLPQTNPTLATTCTAQELDQVQSLAVCQALTDGAAAVGAPPQPATLVLGTASFTTANGGTALCGGSFTTVRYRADANGVPGTTADTPCTASITLSPAVAPATYSIQVALLRGDGSVVGTTTCGAETSPGLTSSATCQGLQ